MEDDDINEDEQENAAVKQQTAGPGVHTQWKKPPGTTQETVSSNEMKKGWFTQLFARLFQPQKIHGGKKKLHASQTQSLIMLVPFMLWWVSSSSACNSYDNFSAYIHPLKMLLFPFQIVFNLHF